MEIKYIDKEKEVANQERIIAEKKWQCMCPHCTETAINSHLLQQHGILDIVAENGHLYEMRFEDFYKWHTNDPMKVKRIGIQQAISFPLFCNKHDTELFAPIECNSIDFDDYTSQLLFSYRGLCSEIRKKQFVQIRNAIWPDCALKEESESGTNAGIKDLKYFKYLFEVELSTPKHKFTFLHVSYPFLPIYASGTVSFEPVDYNNQRSIDEAIKKTVWDGFFINIIPQNNSLEIIIGYHNNHVNKDLRKYVDSWKGLSTEQLQVKLTDLFTARLDTWGMSPSLYVSISDDKKEWFMETQKKIYLDFSYDIRRELKENLFAD